jgi:hypothetical protein
LNRRNGAEAGHKLCLQKKGPFLAFDEDIIVLMKIRDADGTSTSLN